MSGAKLAVVVVLVLVAGCGEDSRGRTTVSGLPDIQLQLVGDLCAPTGSRAEAKVAQALAEGQLRALQRAYKLDPEALTSTTYFNSDGDDGREDVSIRRLVEIELEGVPEIVETGTREEARCARATARTMRALLDS